MPKVKPLEKPLETGKSRPARTPEAREKQLVALAYDLAEERLRNGTASSAEIVQLMKWGSRKERLEQELEEKKIELMKAKTEALQSAKRIEALYGEAIEAMRRYSGAAMYEDSEDEDLY